MCTTFMSLHRYAARNYRNNSWDGLNECVSAFRCVYSLEYAATFRCMHINNLAISHVYLSGRLPSVVTRVNNDGSSFSFCIFACHSASFFAASFFSRIVLHLM